MPNEDVLEQSSQQEDSSVDIADLLEIANSKVFDDQDGFTERNKNFEKVTSFFDLIKSSSHEDTNLAEQDQSSENSEEETLDEEIIGLKVSSSDGASNDREIEEEIVGLKISSSDGASDDKEIEEEIVGLKISSLDGASEDPQTEGTMIEPEVERSDISGEEEISPENFEPLDVIEQSRETVEKSHKLIVMLGKSAQDELNKASKHMIYKYKLVPSITASDSKILIVDAKK